MNKIIEKAKITHDLNKDEILELLQNDDINEELFKAADEVRQKYLGDYVHLRGLIEFTNICKRNCLYCGLRRDNKNIERYRLTEEEILDFAKRLLAMATKHLCFKVEKMIILLKKE